MEEGEAAVAAPAPDPAKRVRHNTVGLAKASGRDWKAPGQRAGTLKNPKLSTSWDKKMATKAEEAAFKERKRAAQQVRKEAAAEERRRREAVKARKAEKQAAAAVTTRVSAATARRMMKSKKVGGALGWGWAWWWGGSLGVPVCDIRHQWITCPQRATAPARPACRLASCCAPAMPHEWDAIAVEGNAALMGSAALSASHAYSPPFALCLPVSLLLLYYSSPPAVLSVAAILALL